LRRPARLHGLLRVEDRERPADDLGRLVALEALGAGVPSDDAALGVEHEDRVVAHLLDEEPEALLAQAQVLLGALARGALGARSGGAHRSIHAEPASASARLENTVTPARSRTSIRSSLLARTPARNASFDRARASA